MTRGMFQKEILHHWDVWSMDDSQTWDDDLGRKDEGVGGSSKKPSTTGNFMHLRNSMDENTGKSPLVYKSEKA